MSTKINKIVFDIDEKKIELTADQAKQMKNILDELFGTKVVREEHHHHNRYSYPFWRWDTPDITCNRSNIFYENGTVSCSL